MSGIKLLLDTNAISYFLSGNQKLKEILDDKEIFVSFITEMELLSYSKLSSKDRNRMKLFLSECQIIELSAEIKKIAIQTRILYRIKLPDAIISATSIYLGLPLVTLDSDFTKIKNLDLILVQL